MDRIPLSEQPIEAGERTGVLNPANLSLFDAKWLTPSENVSSAVAAYWSVKWRMAPGHAVEQTILEFPAVTLSIESGSVPAPYVVTGVQRRAWSRTISGEGEVFAIRLRPAGLSVVSDLDPTGIGVAQAVTRDLDPVLAELLSEIRVGSSPAERAHLADAAIGAMLERRPPPQMHVLANDVVDALAGPAELSTSVATALGVSERAVLRALRATLGMGPKAVARRIRLQEVVRLLSQPNPRTADIATALGYSDQPHLIRDFKGVAGMTPGQYLRQLKADG